jgi:hypothetical protein
MTLQGLRPGIRMGPDSTEGMQASGLGSHRR